MIREVVTYNYYEFQCSVQNSLVLYLVNAQFTAPTVLGGNANTF